MAIVTEQITLSTQQPIDIIDITELLQTRIEKLKIQAGLATIMSHHTTTAININEREPHLQRDMVTFLKRFVARDGHYGHNDVASDGRDNAHSHLLALLMTATVSIPIVNGQLLLGSWQSVFFVELDGPRNQRLLTLHLLNGESEM
jgi:secondary thiamine-phosphate synthase enzyme